MALSRYSAYIFAVVGLLLCVHYTPVFSLQVHEHDIAISSSRLYGDRKMRLIDDPSNRAGDAVEGIRFDMMYRDNHKSPLYEPNLTSLERISNAAKRSQIRTNFIRTILGLENKDFSQKVTFQSPLSASPGSYVMTITLGTPPQTKTAIADTGSDLIWVQCGPCQSCYNQPDPVFNVSLSTSYHQLPCSSELCYDLYSSSCSSTNTCQYSYGYGDGSTTNGDFARETITLSTTTGSKQSIPHLAFGCGHNNQGTFSGTDGLVGLGQGPISFPSQLGSLFGNIFSYCLVPLTDSASQTSPLLFGQGAVPKSANLKYTPLLTNNQNPTFYYVQVTGISVNGESLGIPSSAFNIGPSGDGGVILDSGTTITQLIDAAYSPFLSKIKSLVNYTVVDSSNIGLDLCYDLSGVENPTFPSVTFHLTNVDLDLPANNVFVVVDDQGSSCLAFQGTSDFSIYGNIQQQNFHVVYDRHKGRVGFVSATCDKV